MAKKNDTGGWLFAIIIIAILLIFLLPAILVSYLYYRSYERLPDAPGKGLALFYAITSCIPLYIANITGVIILKQAFDRSYVAGHSWPLSVIFITLLAWFAYANQIKKIKGVSGDAGSYREELEAAVSDKKLDDDEIEHLKTLIEKYKLPADALKDIHEDVFISTLLNCVSDDFVINPSEKKLLKKMTITLNIDQEVIDYADQIVEKSRNIKRIIDGKEEGIMTPDFIPQKNEECLLLEDCALYENVKKGFYVGTSVALKEIIPLGKLLNPRLYLGKRVNYEQLKEIDNGKIALTTKRIVFVGESTTRAFKLDDIIGLDIGPDCFQINRPGKTKREVFHMSPDVKQVFIGALFSVMR